MSTEGPGANRDEPDRSGAGTAGSDAGTAGSDAGTTDPAVEGRSEAGERPDAGAGRTVTTRAPGDDVVHPAAADREFGLRGYLLLATMALALVVAPVVVYLRPPALSWEVRLVVFPLLPALLLGAVAVWATTRP